MKKHSLILAFLLICHSFAGLSQGSYAYKTKDDFSGYFRQSEKVKTYPSQNQGRVTQSLMRYQSDGEVQIYAVVVGVGDYSAMPKLAYPASDARRFYQHLISPEGGSIPKSHIRFLQDADATKANVNSALKQIAKKADGNDVIVFYFSGHGLDGAFLPVDFNGYGNLLDHATIVRTLESSRAKHKICIADACFSGALNYSLSANAKGPNPLTMQYYYNSFESSSGGMALLMSSSAHEASWEDESLRQGVFTYYLIKGMSGKADFNHNRIVEVSELFAYVQHMVTEHTFGHQTPVLTGDYDEEMPVAIRN